MFSRVGTLQAGTDMRKTTSLPSGEMSDEEKADVGNHNTPKTFGDWGAEVAYEVDPSDVNNANLPRDMDGWGRTVGEKGNHNMPNDLATGEMSDEEKADVGNHNMPKSLSFKDFMVVDYTPGMGDYISYQAQKRKRGHYDTYGDSYDAEEGHDGDILSEDQDPEVEEALSHAQRVKASLRMKKMSKRIQVAKKRAMKRTPTMDVIKKRAFRSARTTMFKKMTRGQSKGDVSFAKRSDIEKRLDKMKPRLQRMAQKLIPVIRKKDRDRKNPNTDGNK